jgi:PEP-CTERM motif
MSSKTIRIGFTSWAALLLLMSSIANAQTTYSYLWKGGGTNNWGTGADWGLNPPLNLGFNGVTPSAFFEEQGLINNGNTVNVTTSQTQFNSNAADNQVAAAGVTVDGVTTTGNGSTLNVASGGTLNILVTYGTNGAPPSTTPTAGTGSATLVNHGAITIQPGGALSVQGNVAVTSGTVTVGGAGAGGQLIAGNLNEAGTNSAVNLLGSATVNVSNGTVLNGTTTITGPNVVFNTPSISMANTTVFSPVITSNAVAGGGGHSVIQVTGSVSVNGTIRPQFSGAGVAPHLGDTWTLWDSSQIQGTFATSDATGTGAGLPTGLGYALTTTKTGSVHGVKGQLTVENFLTAQVDRTTGQVTILNTDSSVGTGVTITGYQIASAGGALKPVSFTSPFGGLTGDYNNNGAVDAADFAIWRHNLGGAGATLANRDPANGGGVVSQADYNSWKANFGGGGSGAWDTVNSSATSIAQLNSTSSSVVGLSASKSVGNIYDPVSLETSFGTAPVADLTFSYTRSDGRTVSAPVTYTGTGLANTLVLQVDPGSGKAKIINDSVFNNIKIDGYSVTSASNSLLTTDVTGWNSLQKQGVTGWEEADPTASVLSELNPTTSSTLNAGQTLATTTGLFKVGGTQDLAFQFRVPGTGAGTGVINGVVRYLAFGSGAGALGASEVPEPSSLILLVLGGFATLVARRRK